METKLHGTQLFTAVPSSWHASASLSLNAGHDHLKRITPSLTDSTQCLKNTVYYEMLLSSVSILKYSFYLL